MRPSQARAVEEIDAQLGGEPPSAANVGGLQYLEAVVLEALRVRPPAYLVGRCAARALELGPYSLPAGTLWALSDLAGNRHKASHANIHMPCISNSGFETRLLRGMELHLSHVTHVRMHLYSHMM